MAFLIIETVAFVQIIRGLFGDLSAEAWKRIASIESTLDLRRQQLASAIEKDSDKVDVYKRTVDSLEESIVGIKEQALAMEAQGIWIALAGLFLLAFAKAAQCVLANWALEKRFSEWRSEPTLKSGISIQSIAASGFFMALIVSAAIVHYSFPDRVEFLGQFPTDPDIRMETIGYVEAFFEYCVLNGEAFFDFITFIIRVVLDALETVFVGTPWIVVASLLILLTALTAGPRTAIYTGAFLAYMGILGFWVKGHDNSGITGNSCMSLHRNWYSSWNVLRTPPKTLCLYSTNHGFHANNASIRIHDPCDCIFWNWKTCCRGYNDDFWRDASGALNCIGT